MKIKKSTTLTDLAYIISNELVRAGIPATLSGGGAVTVYTENRYVSRDLDFVSPADNERIGEVMKGLGFKREGRHFIHDDCEFTVEFPPSPVMLGSQPSKDDFLLEREGLKLKILSPTESTMDRLAGFYAWRDRQSLRQAIMICAHHEVDLKRIKTWSKVEGYLEQYEEFRQALKETKKAKS